MYVYIKIFMLLILKELKIVRIHNTFFKNAVKIKGWVISCFFPVLFILSRQMATTDCPPT